MKKVIVGFLLAQFMYSCSSDFKVGADYKEITVVYGLLSKSDTAQYIKITKGFYDEKIDNLIIAKNPDSLYFKDLEVTIDELSGSSVTNTFNLQKVELHDEGYIKSTGTFADNPAYAYKFKALLRADRIYRLRVKNNETGKVIEGETPIIDSAANVFSIAKPFTALMCWIFLSLVVVIRLYGMPRLTLPHLM
jgi:hypothetical protein